VNAIDPEDEYPRAADWDEVTHDEYVLAYYEPFIALLDAGPTRRQGSYYTVNLAAPGVRVGLLHPLVREIRRSARRTRPEGLFAAVKEIVGEWEEVSLPVAGKNFPDGSTFHTRWDLEEVEGD
jgi:hypothetical protein